MVNYASYVWNVCVARSPGIRVYSLYWNYCECGTFCANVWQIRMKMFNILRVFLAFAIANTPFLLARKVREEKRGFCRFRTISIKMSYLANVWADFAHLRLFILIGSQIFLTVVTHRWRPQNVFSLRFIIVYRSFWTICTGEPVTVKSIKIQTVLWNLFHWKIRVKFYSDLV